MSELTEQIKLALAEKSIPEKAAFFPRFFKTKPGEYGEGDKFLGVIVPEQRKIAKSCFKEISLDEIRELLQDEYHEVRLTSIFILLYRYEKLKTDEDRKVLVDFYIEHLDFVNNWDLVDSSCHKILGHYFRKKDKYLFYEFAESGQLWRQRIAMISAYHWIKHGEFEDAFAIAELLVSHPHDLIQKAVGWMLREIGNQDLQSELAFLRMYFRTMPRTALRYAIEKFDSDLRQKILAGEDF
jgi:3-methyladenine DNA glycosylase AlkD